MAGTVQGAKKTVESVRKKYGKNFYKEIGKKGGAAGRIYHPGTKKLLPGKKRSK